MKNIKISNILIWDSLSRAVKHYGIEGCEETIKRVYKQMPKLRNKILKEFNKIYKAKSNGIN